MAARRRSSARRSSSRSGTAEPSSSREAARGAPRGRASARSSGGGRSRPRAGSARTTENTRAVDGKYPVSCPRCAARYNVPEEYLDQVVTCKQCKSAFTPRQSLGVARRPGKGAGAGGGLLKLGFIALPFVLLVIIYNIATTKEETKAAPLPEKPTLSQSHPAFRVLSTFLSAVENRQALIIDINLHWAKFWQEKGAKSDEWSLLGNEAQQRFKASFTEELLKQNKAFKAGMTREERRALRARPALLADVFVEHSMKDHRLGGAAIELADDVKELDIPIDIYHKERPTLGHATVTGHVVKIGNDWKVAGWELSQLPPVKLPKRKKMRHKYIKPPKWEDVVVKGKKYKQYQTDIVPLPHLEDTPPPLRKEIDRLIDVCYTESENPKEAILASTRLIEIGKQAVPRILNSFYEHKGTTRTEVEGMNILIKAYNNITGGNIAFLPDLDPNAVFGGSHKDREVLLKTAYAHWYFTYWKKEEDMRGDTDEELDKEFELGTPKKRPGKKR